MKTYMDVKIDRQYICLENKADLPEGMFPETIVRFGLFQATMVAMGLIASCSLDASRSVRVRVQVETEVYELDFGFFNPEPFGRFFSYMNQSIVGQMIDFVSDDLDWDEISPMYREVTSELVHRLEGLPPGRCLGFLFDGHYDEFEEEDAKGIINEDKV